MNFNQLFLTVTTGSEEITTAVENIAEGVGKGDPWHGFDLYNLLMKAMNVEPGSNQSALFFLGAILLCIAVGYLIGSINPSIILSRKLFNDDVRNHGSGNAGMTNMMRTYGKKMAPIIFFLDFFKAALAILLGSLIAPFSFGGSVAALFAVVGHMFPVYYKFKGGKGVSCMMACILILSPISFLIIGPVYIAIVLIFKYVSLASVIAAMLFPLVAFAFKSFWGSAGLIPFVSLIIGILVVFMHRENLKRLFEGKESKTEFFKKKKKKGEDGEEEAEKPEEKPAEPERIYSDKDFVKCSCGRIIPITRKTCIYCKAENPAFDPEAGTREKEKSKKSLKKSNKSKKK